MKEKEKNIIKKAEKEGYRLVNDNLTKEIFQPVIEVYARSHTDYEAYGSFYMLKKVIPISKEILKKVKQLELTKENLIDNFAYNDGIAEEIKGLDYFYEILEVGDIEPESITSIVEKEQLEEQYGLEDGQNLYLEFFFNTDNMDGYISIYDMPVKDLNEQKEINIFFNKYLTYN
ncbi:TPA: hypothetical protein PTW12_002696 [Clostridium botulinum]|nr:hypothetical protein [Clostridium botulinum]